jgi:hypothetical protein
MQKGMNMDSNGKKNRMEGIAKQFMSMSQNGTVVFLRGSGT